MLDRGGEIRDAFIDFGLQKTEFHRRLLPPPKPGEQGHDPPPFLSRRARVASRAARSSSSFAIIASRSAILAFRSFHATFTAITSPVVTIVSANPIEPRRYMQVGIPPSPAASAAA